MFIVIPTSATSGVLRVPGTIPYSIWTPGQLPGLLPSISVALQRYSNLLFQDAAKTIPALAHNDPVHTAVCPWTAGEYTAASDSARPLLQTNGLHWWFQFDGIDDMLSTAAIYSRADGEPLSFGMATRGPNSPNKFRIATTGEQNAGKFRGFGTLVKAAHVDFGTPDFYASPQETTQNHYTHVSRVNGTAIANIVNGVHADGVLGSTPLGYSNKSLNVGNLNYPAAGPVYGAIWSHAAISDADMENLHGYLTALRPA